MKKSNFIIENGVLIKYEGINASVTIPDSVTSIGDCAFYGCKSLTKIVIPSSVTSIGDCAFYNCTSLAEIKIPNSVTIIGYGAFRGCTSLTEIKKEFKKFKKVLTF